MSPFHFEQKQCSPAINIKVIFLNESPLPTFLHSHKHSYWLLPVDFHRDRTYENNVSLDNILCLHGIIRFLAGDRIQLYICKPCSQDSKLLQTCLYYYSLQRKNREHLKELSSLFSMHTSTASLSGVNLQHLLPQGSAVTSSIQQFSWALNTDNYQQAKTFFRQYDQNYEYVVSFLKFLPSYPGWVKTVFPAASRSLNSFFLYNEWQYHKVQCNFLFVKMDFINWYQKSTVQKSVSKPRYWYQDFIKIFEQYTK